MMRRRLGAIFGRICTTAVTIFMLPALSATAFELPPLDQRPVEKISCEEALSSPDLRDVRSTMSRMDMSQFNRIFDDTIASSDCKEKQIAGYMETYKFSKLQVQTNSSGGNNYYFLYTLNKIRLVFWRHEYVFILNFNPEGELVRTTFGPYR